MPLDLELALPEHTIELLFGGRAVGYALRQFFLTGGAVYCVVSCELPH